MAKAEVELLDLLEAAWGIIANGYHGCWETAPSDWREAAERFRDEYHKALEASNKRDAQSDFGPSPLVKDKRMFDAGVAKALDAAIACVERNRLHYAAAEFERWKREGLPGTDE